MPGGRVDAHDSRRKVPMRARDPHPSRRRLRTSLAKRYCASIHADLCGWGWQPLQYCWWAQWLGRQKRRITCGAARLPMPNSPVWTSPALNRPRPFPATENLWHFWGGPGRPKRRLGRRSAKWNLPQFNARRLKRTRRCQSRASRACFLCRLVTRFNLDQASGWLADRRYEYLGGADCWRSAQAVSQGGQRICWHDYAQARESCPSSA